LQFNFFDTIELQAAKGQTILPSDDILFGGFSWTSFMDEFAVPLSINPDTSAAGTVFRRQPQLGYSHALNDFNRVSTAIELGPGDDFTLVNADDQRLRRWPDLIMRWRWSDSTNPRTGNSFMVAALVRALGREDVTYQEDFATGWGINAMLKLNAFQEDDFFVGCVAGKGIGSYIFGFLPSAAAPPDNMPAGGPESGELVALGNLGTYIGYTRVWRPGYSQSNVGAGFASADTTTAMPLNAIHEVANTWINHEWRITSAFAVGVEYQYAMREVRDGNSGDDHRAMLSAQFFK
jgi:hypothetical protein